MSLDVLQDELHNLMVFPGPDIETGLIRKINHLAHQVHDINVRFLDAKFLSRLTHINVFALKDLQISDEIETVKDDILEPTTRAAVFSETDKTTSKDITKIIRVEAESEPHGLAQHNPSAHSPELGTFWQSTADQLGIHEQSAALLRSKKGTIACNYSSQTALLDFPVVRASPFSRYTSCIYTTYGNVYRDSTYDHAALARGDKYVEGKDDWLRNLKHGLYASQSGLGTTSEFILARQLALLHLAPCTKLPTVHSDPELFDIPFLEWVFHHEKFKNFEMSVGPCTLYIQGTREDWSRTAMISQHIYLRYEHRGLRNPPPGITAQNAAFYFQFNRSDSRYNSIKAMLATFLTEVTWNIWSHPGEAVAINRTFGSLENLCNWSLPILFTMFMGVRKSKRVGRFTIFLGCFDDCIEDERVWFIRNVLDQQRRSDNYFRLVITTGHQDEFLSQCLSTAHVIHLQECPAPLTGYAIDEEGHNADGLKPYLKDMLQKRQVFNRLKPSLEAMIANYERVPHLGYRVLDWLRNSGRGVPITEVATIIDKLNSATPQNVVSTIFYSTLPDERNKFRAIYQWVTNAVEPMSLEALGQALAVSMTPRAPLFDIDYDQLLQDITTMFGGIIVKEGLYVRFSHESFYNTEIPSVDGEDEDPSVVHGVLAEACLKHLMHTEVQTEYAKLSVGNCGGKMDVLETPLLLRHDFLEYAVRFWAEHYRLCCPPSQPTTLVVRFFNNMDVRNKWAEAHYVLSNPFTRIHRGYFSSLPFMAALGLEDILSQQLEDGGYSERFITDVWLAISEAARNGHNNVVHQLLQKVPLQESKLEDAITWAACSDNKVALASLLEKAALLENVSWSGALLYKAVSLGHNSLVSACIEAVSDPGDFVLHEAIAWGQQQAVRLLLKSKYNLLNVPDVLGRTALLTSAKIGQPEIVQMLIDAGANLNDKDINGASFIDIAILSGQHKALALFLEASSRSGVVRGETGLLDVQAHLTLASNLGRTQCTRVIFEHAEHLDSGSDIDALLYAICGVAHTADICRSLIARGAKPHQLHTDKGALLHRALITEDKDLIRVLVEEGAELTYVDKHNDDTTPLSFAIQKCSLEVAELLLKMGASANYVPGEADSPLFIACYETEDISKAQLLLNYGADIHWKSDDGWTALHGSYDLPKLVSFLLSHGADVNGMSNYGTPLMMAARWNYVDVLKRLLAHPAIEVNLKFNRDDGDSEVRGTALLQAVEQGSHESGNLLIEAGAEIDERFGSAGFLLESAKLDGSEECRRMVQKFLDRGNRIDSTDDKGNTTLHGVSSTTPTWILQHMVECGAPMDSPNNDGLTPLAVAVEKGNVAAVKYFIAKGARVSICGPSFGSLLHLVCQVNQPEKIDFKLFQILVDSHAYPNLPGPEPLKESLLHQVIRTVDSGMQERIITYLIRNYGPEINVNAPGGPQNYPIMAAAYAGEHDILEYLIHHDANVNVHDDLGRRTVHYLSGRVRWFFTMRPLRVLAKFGADLMVKDHFGRTALHFIAGSNDLDLLKFFLKRLPEVHDINLKDNDGWTPLMWACRTSTRTKVIDSLVKDYGADIWAISFDGEWSARKLACLSNQSDESKSLLQPPENEWEREELDGSKQTWDPTFHSISPGKQHSNFPYCDSCFMIIVGTIYDCMVCDDYILCFKCYPQRTEMHDEYHDFEEYVENGSPDESDSSEDNKSESSDRVSATREHLDVNGDDEDRDASEAEYSDN
ncbi:ankyrin repeat protein [Colletotrichum asianum]